MIYVAVIGYVLGFSTCIGIRHAIYWWLMRTYHRNGQQSYRLSTSSSGQTGE